MKTKNVVLAGVILAVGTVLHLVIPGFVAGIKPDFLLVTVFLGILFNRNVPGVIVISLAGGILAAMTTGFPGGQIPNIIDKVAAGLFFYGLLRGLPRENAVYNGLLTALGTMVSGIIFLSCAKYMVGLPGGAGVLQLFTAIVLPTAVANGVLGSLVYSTVYSRFLGDLQ